MEEKYLIINAGSSSLKVSLYNMPSMIEIVNMNFEKIGEDDSFYTLKFGQEKRVEVKEMKTHAGAVKVMLEELLASGFILDPSEIKAVGHRVLHGGEFYDDSIIITDEDLEKIKFLSKLGPLHQPVQITGIENMQLALPNVPQIAVFDTAFHQTIPEVNYRYAVPNEWYTENGVRKYGFHGTSHKYITEFLQVIYRRKNVNLIILHMGNGVSFTVIKDGKSLNTTMGLTPTAGVMMGTRSGTIDPSIHEYICKQRNMSIEEVTNSLNTRGGLLGICGKNDFRDVMDLVKKGDKDGLLALEMYKASIRDNLAMYYFALNGEVDAVIFTGGIGENNPELREDIINMVSYPMKVKVNPFMNDNIAKSLKYQKGEISTHDSECKFLVIPTDEESVILEDTYRLVNKKKNEKNMKLEKVK